MPAMNKTDSPASFPLFTLRPVADVQHAWVAMALEAVAPMERAHLERLFGDLRFAEALDGLPCIIVADAGPRECADWAPHLPSQHIILRFPVANCVSDADGTALHRLHEAGFGLLAEGPPRSGAALCPDTGRALDCTNADWPAVEQLLAGHPGRHLALNVDTLEQLERCHRAGFVWFDGNYALHPQPGRTRNATRHALLLQLLSLLTHDGDSQAIERLIKQDAQLSYQLLRLVNSVAFSLNHRIASFGQAIALLGRRQLQRWLQLLLYARPEVGGRSPLLPRAALRAALMETLCGEWASEIHERAFMVGMFSLLDLMLGTRMAEILQPLHLSNDISDALQDRTGSLGLMLRVVDAAESGNMATLAAALAEARIGKRDWAAALLKASHWAIRVSREA
jgi:c-di-GMP phosphodiesterase